MSNDPNTDPIAHAAKFLWIFALLPCIAGALVVAVPSETPAPWWGQLLPFAVAALIAGIGGGVYRRSQLVTQIGIALFSLAAVALIGGAVVEVVSKGTAESMRAAVIAGALIVWPIIKLRNALAAMRTTR